MRENYTRLANDRCFDLADEALSSAWEEIENTPEDCGAERWREKLRGLAREFSLSGRFALMRLLLARTKGVAPDRAQSGEDIELTTADGVCRIRDVSIEHAETLTAEELAACETALLQLAAEGGSEIDARARFLVGKAMRDEEAMLAALRETAPAGKPDAAARKLVRAPLSRREALELGHLLHFSLEEMSWFLLRVFDFEDGFRYNYSDDLIEAYCFLTRRSAREAGELRDAFRLQRASCAGPEEPGGTDWTRQLGTSLPSLVAQWPAPPEENARAFMQWLGEQSARLDRPSSSAAKLYRCLACLARAMAEGTLPVPAQGGFPDSLAACCSGESEVRMREMLFDGGVISPGKCAKTAAVILERNKELFTSAPDRAKAWRTISVSGSGEPRLIMAGRPDAGRSRVQELLCGSAQPEKGDVLHLLWFAFSLFWLEHPIYTPDQVFNALADFTEAAEQVLDMGLLPPFYPPHMTEQSMMLSIVMCSTETGEPADVYAEICESLIAPRKRK